MKFSGMFRIWLLMGLCAHALAQPRVVYVDNTTPSADDANPGTAIAPWKTLAKGASAVSAGDTVYLRGVFNEQLVTMTGGDAANGNIIFRSVPDARAVIDGTGKRNGETGVLITHSYVTVGDIEIRNWPGDGVNIDAAGWILVCGCDIHDVYTGVHFINGAHDFILCSTDLHHFDFRGADVSSAGVVSCSAGLFRGTRAFNARRQQTDAAGFMLDGGPRDSFAFENCAAWDVQDGFAIRAEGTRLDRCLSRSCRNAGFRIQQDGVRLVNCVGARNTGADVLLEGNGSSGAVTLSNCTFHAGGSFGIHVEQNADTLRMFNTILSGSLDVGLGFDFAGTPSYQGDYNIFHSVSGIRLISLGQEHELPTDSLSAWIAFTGQDSHSIALASDAGLYADAPADDFHLSSGSDAIDRGRAAGSPPIDFDGRPRPIGKGVDIGAFEYQGTSAVERIGPIDERGIEVYPNPASTSVYLRIRNLPDNAELMIFDPLGRHVRSLHVSARAAGDAFVVWDLASSAGTAVPPGLYSAVAVSPVAICRASILVR